MEPSVESSIQDPPSVQDLPSVESLKAQMEDTKKEIQVYITKIQEFIDELCNRIGDVTEQYVPQANIPVTGDQTEITELRQENEQLREIINGNKDGLTEIKNKLLGLKNCDKQSFVDELTSDELSSYLTPGEETEQGDLSSYLPQVPSSGSELGSESSSGSLGGREPIPLESQQKVKDVIGQLQSIQGNTPPTSGGNKRRNTKRKKTKRKKLKKKRSTKK